MNKFKSVEFLTGAEKGKILKDWVRFLAGGLKSGDFSKRIYNGINRKVL